MKLICEIQEGISPVIEEESGIKNIFVVGPALVADEKNKNGRLYRMPILREAVNTYIRDNIKTNRAVGELGHPAGPTLNLDRVSHKFISITEDGNRFIAKAKLLETPMGKIAKNLINEGVVFGFSSRGMGTLKPNSEGIMEVQNDFRLATAADLVADPSAPGAFVKGIVENIEWYLDAASGTWVQEKIEPMQKEIKKMNLRELSERKLKLFEYFLSELAKPKK